MERHAFSWGHPNAAICQQWHGTHLQTGCLRGSPSGLTIGSWSIGSTNPCLICWDPVCHLLGASWSQLEWSSGWGCCRGLLYSPQSHHTSCSHHRPATQECRAKMRSNWVYWRLGLAIIGQQITVTLHWASPQPQWPPHRQPVSQWTRTDWPAHKNGSLHPTKHQLLHDGKTAQNGLSMGEGSWNGG